jgi:thiamine-monophosphate kinase
MRIKDIGEFELIRKLSRGCIIRPQGVVLGIGDDAAVVTAPSEQHVLLTTDMLVENIHFIRDATTGFNLGYKALAVNLSDIAAMGGVARDAFISIAIPHRIDTIFIEELYDGLKALAAEFDVNILGGDTTGALKDLVINVTVTGYVDTHRILRRDAARVGDSIFTTGCLGDSRAGLYLLQQKTPLDTQHLQDLVSAHLRPRPMLHEGRFLAQFPEVRAGIDISDGLSSDLAHILDASQTGARLRSQQLPISSALEDFCQQFQLNPMEFVLSGGEDYALLITAAPEAAENLMSAFQQQFNTPLHLLGEITSSGKLEIVTADGHTQSIAATGWDHFGGRPTDR